MIAPLILIASALSFWAGVGWLIVNLFRKASVRPPLGAILLGVVLLFAGGYAVLLSYG